MPKKEKIVWVFPGGGNQAAYAYGACVAARDLGIRSPDIIVASSGGAANAFYYTAGQISRAYQIWGNEISSKKILSGARFWKMFDRDLMVDGVFMKDPDALNLKKIKDSSVEVYTGVTNTKTGLLEFISNRDTVNLLHVLKATVTVPVFSGLGDQSIEINGEKYMDSRVSSRYELLVEKALSFNPDRIIIFGNLQSKKYRFGGGKIFYGFWLIGRSLKNLDFNFMKNQLRLMEEQKRFIISKSSRIIFLHPDQRIKILPWVNTESSLQGLLELGYRETMENRALRSIEGKRRKIVK